MSGRGRAIAAAVAAIALLALAAFLAARLLSGTVTLARSDGGVAEPDPQFAEPAEANTRPPELLGEDGSPVDEADPSAGWDLGVQTPVDKTAEELARELEDG